MEPEIWMIVAAREIRVKIHDMGEDQFHECQRGSNPANAKWLDSVALEDARIIAKHAPKVGKRHGKS